MNSVVAIMPIKTNNERLPGKNTKILGEKPLLQWQLKALKNAGIGRVFVFCSDRSIDKYLLPGTTFLLRPAELDLPTSNFTQIFDSFIKEIDADIYIYAHATAPFVESNTIKDCLDMVSSGKYDSAFCATKIQDFLWKNGSPLNFDATNLPRSQDLDIIYRETSGVYVFTKDVFLTYRRRIGMKPYIKEVNIKEAVDINTIEDFELAKLMLNFKV